MRRILLLSWHVLWWLGLGVYLFSITTGRFWTVQSFSCQIGETACPATVDEMLMQFDGASLLFFPEKALQRSLSQHTPPLFVQRIERHVSGQIALSLYQHPLVYSLQTTIGESGVDSAGVLVPSMETSSLLTINARVLDASSLILSGRVDPQMHRQFAAIAAQVSEMALSHPKLELQSAEIGLLHQGSGLIIVFELAQSPTQLARAAYVVAHDRTLFATTSALLDVRFRYPVLKAGNLATPK